MTNVVEIRGLTHAYGDVVALSDLDLGVSEGITGLVGANGAGKTTMLRVLLGLLHPSAGSSVVLGHDPEREPLEVRARVGYMPEGNCLPKDQTAADFVSYAAQLAGIPPGEARRRSSETLFLVGLDEERFRYLGDFSTGMRQRVKLAQAIVHDPDLVLLDEPASGLDPDGRTQMLELVGRLAEFGIDVVMSSHVLSDIEQTCDWVVMLDAGKVLWDGPIRGFAHTGTLVVEVLDKVEELASALTTRGFDIVFEGRRLQIASDQTSMEDEVVKAAAEVGSGLVRMVRSAGSLEDLYFDRGGAPWLTR